jgi:hypothetical protein
MEFKELLAAFATKYGIEGLDDTDDAAVLEVDGVCVELLDDSQTNGVFGALMLQANFMLRSTEGATLCQNPESGTYALVRQFPLALTDVDSLSAGLESLVNQTENWRKMLTSLRMAEDARPAASKTGDSHHDMISNGFFHV